MPYGGSCPRDGELGGLARCSFSFVLCFMPVRLWHPRAKNKPHPPCRRVEGFSISHCFFSCLLRHSCISTRSVARPCSAAKLLAGDASTMDNWTVQHGAGWVHTTGSCWDACTSAPGFPSRSRSGRVGTYGPHAKSTRRADRVIIRDPCAVPCVPGRSSCTKMRHARIIYYYYYLRRKLNQVQVVTKYRRWLCRTDLPLWCRG